MKYLILVVLALAGCSSPKPAQSVEQSSNGARMCGDYEKRPGVCRSHGIRYQRKRADCTLFAHAVTLEHLRWEDDGGPQHPECSAAIYWGVEPRVVPPTSYGPVPTSGPLGPLGGVRS